MSSDFRRIHDKKERIWAKTQADRPILGRPAWHPHTHCHVFDPGARSCTQVSLSRGLDVGLIEWTERLAQGSKDPQFSVKIRPSQQSTSLEDHKHPLTMSVQWRTEESQREAGRPSTCKLCNYATVTDSRRRSQTSTQRRWPDGNTARPAGLGEAGRPHLAATQAPASRGS